MQSVTTGEAKEGGDGWKQMPTAAHVPLARDRPPPVLHRRGWQRAAAATAVAAANVMAAAAGTAAVAAAGQVEARVGRRAKGHGHWPSEPRGRIRGIWKQSLARSARIGGGPRPRDDPPLLLDRDRRPRARPRSARRGRPTTRRPAGSSRSQTLLPGGARLRTHRCRPAEPTCQHRRCPVTPARHPASAAVRLPRAPTSPPPDHRAVRPPTSGRPSVRTTWRTGTSRRAAEDGRCVQPPRTGVRGWLGRNIQQSA